MTDRTLDFHSAVNDQARLLDLSKEDVTRLKSAVLLKPTRKASPFHVDASKTAETIDNLRQFIRSQRKDYVSLGALSNAEKDRIESEVALTAKACSEQINALKSTIEEATNKQHLTPQAAAHCYGVVLILTDHLHKATSLFDRCKRVRYKQALQTGPLEQFRKQRKLQVQPAADVSRHERQQQQHGADDHQQQEQQQQQQQALQQESQALIEELLRTSGQVQQVERSMREISSLNQMLSTAVMEQVEAIELLYHNALDATVNITRGNVDIRKTIEANRSSRKYMFVLLLVASLLLLFFDWFNS